MTDVERMSGVELQARREYLGLTGEALARHLQVRPRTVRAWEQGRDPIPYRVREEVEALEAETDAAVAQLAQGLTSGSKIEVWRSDEKMRGALTEPRWTARWWRHVARRAVLEVPGVSIEESESSPLLDIP